MFTWTSLVLRRKDSYIAAYFRRPWGLRCRHYTEVRWNYATKCTKIIEGNVEIIVHILSYSGKQDVFVVMRTQIIIYTNGN